MVKNKLQQTQNNLDEVLLERTRLKEENKKLETENTALNKDLMHLKISLNELSSQLANRPNVSALESKLENYEKEVKNLQLALDKSDKYIAELETKQKAASSLASSSSSKKLNNSDTSKSNLNESSKSTASLDNTSNSFQ